MRTYDEFGLFEISKGDESQFYHRDYDENLLFNKSSFLKEWADMHIGIEIKTIIDIGALDGGDSLRFNSWYPNANIYAIEASPHNFSVIKQKIGNRKGLHIFNYAMCSYNGKISFYQTIYEDNSNLKNLKYMIMGSIYDIQEFKKNLHDLKTIDTIEIEAITFDTFCNNNNITAIDIAHIDVEGTGFEVISGMNKILPKLIFIEKEGKEFFKEKQTDDDDLLNLLYEKGYELILHLPNDYLLKLKI